MEAALSKKAGKEGGASEKRFLGHKDSDDELDTKIRKVEARPAKDAAQKDAAQTQPDERGGMDNMLAALRSGRAFSRSRMPTPQGILTQPV